ncbi:hypothetical protein FA95DRAFT_1611999 [Auriscalpium vulgare]|uniref:Uncharacterized protein n=1 Tax=Auriscalpium vulgare TaxID=40419 RepID=A0ACB8R8G6_9AGAM|nr:hypothetical protein FA95DRAFT_1611999 [Auriscalpium vulgare]
MESWGLWDPISRTVPIFRVVGVLDNSFLLGLGQTFGNRSQRGVEVFGLVAELRRMLAMFGVFFDDRTMSYWASPSGALRFTTTTGNVEAQPSTKRVDRSPNRAAVATTATGPNALVNKEVSRTALKCTDKVPAHLGLPSSLLPPDEWHYPSQRSATYDRSAEGPPHA